MITETEVATAQSSPLWQVLADLQAANVRATRLNVWARATDIGVTDAQISAIVDDLAAEGGLNEVAA
ncbi:hypothetical protein ACLBYG_31420 [Methylobacterium sp. D53M]|jgi:ABC-type Fe3+-citrate transport system substrate-binding protein